MRLPSSSQYTFSQVPQVSVPRSTFDRSRPLKTTFDEGLLIPVYWDEVLPGDTISMKLSAFARLATPIHPIMDNMKMDWHFFFVPERLLWDNWERFNGAQDNPEDSIDYLTPVVDVPDGGFDENSLFDYFGLPTKVDFDGEAPRAALLRAYNRVWNEWYRDENLQDSVPLNLDDGPDDPADYVLLRRNKKHDYFTSGLPWPQKGPAVTLQLSGNAPVVSTGENPTFTDGVNNTNATAKVAASGNGPLFLGANSAGAPPVIFGDESGLEADLSTVTAFAINALRDALAVQHVFELDARGGTRYVELLKAHFGVTSPDYRLQRSEYLGGGSTHVNVSPVPQTSATDDTVSPQGNLAAYGTAAATNVGFSKSFVEHGVVIGLVSVRADLTYQQGLHRMWSRRTRFDFYLPSFAHLGEQAVLNKEIFTQASSVLNPSGEPVNDDVFCYQEHWSEYRYSPGVITAGMRSNATSSYDVWHLSQDFDTLPELGPDFIQENAPMERVLAVPTEAHFIYDSFIQQRHTRPMPVYSVPGMRRF